MLIEIAYALQEEQFLWEQEVEEGCTVAQALADSEFKKRFPEADDDKVGIFGKLVSKETRLREGDRIEIYRPLKADPRDRRRRKVEEERQKA
ncbi:RnfH family protein [Thiomicrorhabdus sp.]|uniref:RnfH family protein n=1 Tax=Thiomicrorhabdus sp. TaxID=2039724 RepID=UPI0029C68BC0|nr:RnfH family protein [Thiomicrorhabdus sp.]